jgi:pyroglutamyl-peptidase
MRILVQGFGPFGRFTTNPSELLVRALGGRTAQRAGLHTAVLETTAARVAEAVPALMAEHRPDVWLGVGLAAGRPSLSVEAVAVNLGYWDCEDPEDVSRPRHPVSDQGPAAYLTTLPAEAILDVCRASPLAGTTTRSAKLTSDASPVSTGRTG